MRLEFHQLDRRWEHLRVRAPHRQRRLLASLAESGQQTPIVVVLSKDNCERYLVIDGHKRIAALQQLGRDTVEATVWAMSEAEALLLDRTMRFSRPETALEQGWLLSEMEQRFGYSLEELARRFDRSTSWVSRRLALVAWREGSHVVRERILAEPELFLKTQRQTPTARPAAAGLERDLEMAVAILHRASRQLAEALPEMTGPQQEQAQGQIENARRELDRMAARIGKEQEPTHVEPGATNRDSGTECAGGDQARDCARIETLTPERAQSAALELHQRAGNPTGGESRTLPATDPRSFDPLQGESRAGP
jgi:ParB family transcriptional regulator, chromosome partitioning protein